MRNTFAAALVSLQIIFGGTAIACGIDKPAGDVILKVNGLIGDCNEADGVQLDRAMIGSLPVSKVRTENPWDQGQVTYEGVPLSDLLSFVKAKGSTVSISALNDYHADIPLADIEKYHVILAYKRDGVDLPVRDKGPLFVVFPFSDFPELKTEARYAQSVWQVNRIQLK